MRIAIDYTLAERNPFSGMGIYVGEIVKNLTKTSKGNEVILISRPMKKNRSVGSKILDVFAEIYWMQIEVPRILKKKRIDVAYFPNPPLPFFSSVPRGLTIPDLSYHYDQSMNAVVRVYLHLTYLISSYFAQIITTFSDNSRKDIISVLGVSGDKIKVVSPAVKQTLSKKMTSSNVQSLLRKIGVKKPYILSIPGSFIPRKNMKDLVQAYVSLPKDIRKKITLVLVGNNKDSYFKKFIGNIKDNDLKDNIKSPGYVSDSELLALYKGAFVSVTPSLYEGFGLPPLESMMAGTPAIVYNRSSLPEIVGKAGLVVRNPKELASAIYRVYKTRRLRKRLIKNGRERCKDFSWSSSAKKLGGILQNLYES